MHIKLKKTQREKQKQWEKQILNLIATLDIDYFTHSEISIDLEFSELDDTTANKNCTKNIN